MLPLNQCPSLSGLRACISKSSFSLDNDNTDGGEAGAETVTLLDNSINQDYVYLIGVEDYLLMDGGVSFLSAGAQITITNGVSTVTVRMVASSISETSEYVKSKLFMTLMEHFQVLLLRLP